MYTLVRNNVKANIDTVIQAAKECFPENPILAAITAAQAILESGLERDIPSALALNYNNLFGIKGQGNGNPPSVNLLTTEYVHDDQPIRVYQPFANNKDVLSSFQQHKHVLELDRYKNLWTASSFEEAANLIHSDGYATDPHYPQELIDIYNQYIRGNI